MASRTSTSTPTPSQAPDEPTVVEGYGGKTACSIVGITYRRLDYWARTDLLRPSLSDATGSGSRRRYSYSDVVALKVIKKLLDGGQTVQSARKVVDHLSELGEDLASADLIICGDTVALAHNPEELVDLLRTGQGVLALTLQLAGVVNEVDQAIIELGLGAEDKTAGSEEVQIGTGTKVAVGL